MSQTTLITGGTGFIGSRLASSLIGDGRTVHLIVRPSSNVAAATKLGCHIHVHDGTIRRLLTIVNKIQPDSVFHLASLFISEHASEDVPRLVDSNVAFGSQLLEAMRMSGARHIVNTGTAWQHYCSEAERPSCLYAATKRAFQDILDYYADAHGIRAISLKLFDSYGPNDRRRKLFALLREAAESGQELAMSGGEQQIGLVFIDDIISAFRIAESRLVTESGIRHEVFGVPSGQILSLHSVVDKYQAVFSTKIPVRWGGRPYRSREIMTCWNGEPRLPEWFPQVDIDEGLRRMLAADGPIRAL